MNLLITGARGLMATLVGPELEREGWRLIPARRGPAAPGEARWDPSTGELSTPAPPRAVLHLAGAGLATRRWSSGFKRIIRQSRVDATRALCATLARCTPPPEVLVAASAAGFYGDRGEQRLDEDSGPGTGFLAEVAAEWEAACEPAIQAGIRVVHLRSGMVLTRRGGALKALLWPYRLGLGGPLGSGRQFWSWIAAADLKAVVAEALRNPGVQGPVNLAAPEAVRQREMASTLGRVLRRPALFPAPRFALRVALGEMADEMLLASTRLSPARLTGIGFRWRQPDLEDALRTALRAGG